MAPKRLQETSKRRPAAPKSLSPQTLQRIWGEQPVRVFLSHKAAVKLHVSKLKQSLARCGIAAFVAHEDIEPTEAWQREIERALRSMDALVALLTKDFHNSDWTDQEIGVAMGRQIPLITVRLGRDPYGLMGKGQALGGCSWSDTEHMTAEIFRILNKRMRDTPRLFESALAAYAASDSYDESGWRVEHLLAVFGKLDSDQVKRVVRARNDNSQNRCSKSGKKALLPLLEQWTGKHWFCNGDELESEDKPILDS